MEAIKVVLAGAGAGAGAGGHTIIARQQQQQQQPSSITTLLSRTAEQQQQQQQQQQALAGPFPGDQAQRERCCCCFRLNTLNAMYILYTCRVNVGGQRTRLASARLGACLLLIFSIVCLFGRALSFFSPSLSLSL